MDKRLNPQSATETLSLIIQIWKCSETVNDFESEMACKRQSVPRRKTCRDYSPHIYVRDWVKPKE